MSDPQQGDEEVAVEADVEVLAGSPDATEMAAVTAVLAEVLEELAAEQGRREHAAPSAWQRSQRAVRPPIYAEAGAWRSFSG